MNLSIRNSIAKITSSRWAYKVNSTFALKRIKETCDDGFYIQNLETAIASTGETDVFGDYNDIYNIFVNLKDDLMKSYKQSIQVINAPLIPFERIVQRYPKMHAYKDEYTQSTTPKEFMDALRK